MMVTAMNSQADVSVLRAMEVRHAKWRFVLTSALEMDTARTKFASATKITTWRTVLLKIAQNARILENANPTQAPVAAWKDSQD